MQLKPGQAEVLRNKSLRHPYLLDRDRPELRQNVLVVHEELAPRGDGGHFVDAALRPHLPAHLRPEDEDVPVLGRPQWGPFKVVPW